MDIKKETLDFYSLIKKESGFQVENEGALLNLIQMNFEKIKIESIKVISPEIVRPKKFYILKVGYHHIDEDKFAFYSYPGTKEGSWSNIVWDKFRFGNEIKRVNDSFCVLKISEKQLNFLKIDISKCEILFEL